jgi:hypothetical protein
MSMAILILLIQATTALQCPVNHYLSVSTLPKCTESGLLVKKTKEGHFCWIHIHCLNSHIQPPLDQSQLVEFSCGPKCPCPTWSDGCSYYQGPSTTMSNVKNPLVSEALKAEKPDVCSFELSISCRITWIVGTFAQVELYDGTTHLVKQLQLVTHDFIPGEFECMGTGPTTGSPHYCDDHPCEEFGTRFCFYKQPPATFLKIQNQEILIKSWGHVHKEYFPFKPKKKVIQCDNCTARCLANGAIEADLEEGLEFLEVQTTRKTYRIQRPDAQQVVQLDHEEVSIDYEATVRTISDGDVTREWNLQCLARDVCKNTWNLWEYLLNICAPRFTAFLAGIVVVIVILVLKVIFAIWNCLKCLFCCSNKSTRNKKSKKPCWRRNRNRWSKKDLKKYDDAEVEKAREEEKEKATSALKFTPFKPAKLLPAAFLLFLPMVMGCSQTHTLTAQQEECFKYSNGSLECLFSYNTLITEQPNGQEICFLLQGERKPVGTLTLTLHPVTLYCDAITEWYTRSYEILSISAKRCLWAGSCYGEVCEKLPPNGTVEEFGKKVNQVKGYAVCESSPGGPYHFCGWPTSGCLFYKIYPSILDDKIHHVFRCDWHTRMKITAKLTRGNLTSQHELEMAPGTTDEWLGLRISLLLAPISPKSVLGLKWITDGARVAVISSLDEDTIKKLHCNTKEDASKLNCHFDRDLCDCHPTDDNANCRCSELNLDQYYDSSTLPTYANGSDLLQHMKSEVYITSTVLEAVQIQMTMENFKLTTQVDITGCTMTAQKPYGCYLCSDGAVIPYICKPEFGAATGHVSCKKTNFSVTCDGTNRTARIYWTTAEIQDECQISCPASVSTFSIPLSSLQYVVTSHGTYTPSANGPYLGFGEVDLKPIWNLITGSLEHLLIFIGTIVLSCLTLYCVFKPSLSGIC